MNRKKEIFKAVSVLTVICLVIAVSLTLSNALTEDAIAFRAREDRISAMRRIFDKADEYIAETADVEGGTVEYYKAETDGEITGYIFITEENGYGGVDSVMTGIDPDGTIAAVEMLDVSNETVGLGQNAAEPEFRDRFSGKSGELEVTKTGEAGKIEAITGATVTSKAIVGAVNKALSLFESVKGAH